MQQIPVLVSRYTLLHSSLLMYFHAEIELLLACKVFYTTIADTADTNCSGTNDVRKISESDFLSAVNVSLHIYM